MTVASRVAQTVQSRTLVLLIFSVALPSVEARGRWRERGTMGRTLEVSSAARAAPTPAGHIMRALPLEGRALGLWRLLAGS